MFLKVAKYKNGRSFLSIVEGYRENGKVKQRVIKKIGFLDEFTDQYHDPIKHFKEVAKQMTNDSQTSRYVSLDIDFETSISNENNLLNVGYLPFKYIYDELGLGSFFKYIQQRKLDISFSLDKNLQLLVFSRILYPGSKKSTFENRTNFFEPFSNKAITNHSVYDCLDYFYQYKDQLIKLIWDNSKNSYHRDASKSYYDCTNYYFEIEYNDEDILDDDGNIIEKGLRKRGPEKNRRPDPIVEMGLLMDNTGIPMAYDLFPGNESEKTSLRPIIRKTKAKFGIDRTIVVADRGLNTSDNIYFLAGKNDGENSHLDGYVYGQSVRGGDKEFKSWVLDHEGYKCDLIDDAAFIHKSRKYAKNIKIEKNGKRNIDVTVCQKQMAYYSSKYARKQRKEREKMIEKAKDLIKYPGKYTKATTYGAANYIENLEYDKKTGEIIKEKELVLNKEKIEEDAKYDGYYSIVTSEIELDDFEIRKIYRGLAKIEDTFKVSKTSLSSRPAFVWTKEHIEGHFFTCFVALVIMRLLEKKLNNKYSIEKIIDSAKKYNCINIDKNIYQFIYHNEIIKDISEIFQVDLSRKYQKREEIKKILRY